MYACIHACMYMCVVKM